MKKIAFLMSALFLSSCATTVQYACDDIHDPSCQTLTQTAEQTAYDLPANLPKRKYKTDTKSEFEPGKPLYSTKRLSYVDAGEPILTEPWVASILFTPHVTEQGDLDTGGYLYMKVTDSQWVLEK